MRIPRQSLASLLAFALVGSTLPAQPAGASKGRGGRGGPEPKYESRLIPRGDREILTFETEEQFRNLEDLYESNRSVTPKPGEFTMRYFRARTDGSVQPYGFWLPPSYSADRKHALLIQLHGIGPETAGGRRQTWRGQGTKEWVDTEKPVIVAHPFGRMNTFYQGMGEEDVLQVVDEVMRHFSVDPNRVYIMGHSMGGAGSYTVGLHHPDRFGSITPIDPAMWSPERDEAGLPEWAQPQAASVLAPKLYPNARNIPVFFKNAGAGIQKVSTTFSDGIVAAGGFSTMESFPGMPHHWAPQMSYAMFMGQATMLPINRHPPEVKFFTTTLRYNRAYWVTLDRLTRHNRESMIIATYDDGKPPTPVRRPGQPPPETPPPRTPLLNVTTTNIDAFTLQLGELPPPADRAAALPVKIDGTEVTSLTDPLPQTLHFARNSGAWRRMNVPATSAKRHGMQGPIGDVFNGRFLAVYGDGNRELAIAELDAMRNPPGGTIIHGDFPMKAADKLNADDVANSHLILFGSTATNSVLGRIAPKLPRELIEAGNTLFIHPNPENPNRYVVVWPTKLLSVSDAAPRLGFIQPVNLLPDYVRVAGGRITAAGHFDNEWRLQTSAP